MSLIQIKATADEGHSSHADIAWMFFGVAVAACWLALYVTFVRP